MFSGILLDGLPLVIEQHDIMELRSPVDPNKVPKYLVQDKLLNLVCDALVIPVLALIRFCGWCYSPQDVYITANR